MTSISGWGSSYAPPLYPPQPYQPPSFSQLDSNSDGSISLDELGSAAPGGADSTQSDKRLKALFQAMDSDGNGSVSQNELTAFDQNIADKQQGLAFAAQMLSNPQQANSQIFQTTDKNGDGSVTLDEFSQSSAANNLGSDQVKSIFNLIDSNGDGSISQSESQSFFSRLASESSGSQGTGHVHHGGHHHAGGPGGGLAQALEAVTGTDSSDDATASASTDTGSSTGADTGSAGTGSPLDLLAAAQSAYQNVSSTSLIDQLANILDSAA